MIGLLAGSAGIVVELYPKIGGFNVIIVRMNGRTDRPNDRKQMPLRTHRFNRIDASVSSLSLFQQLTGRVGVWQRFRTQASTSHPATLYRILTPAA
jgi:hypothetical protein